MSEELPDASDTWPFETIFGTKTYQEVSDLLAQPLLELLDDVAVGVYDSHPLDVDLLRMFHKTIVVGVMPDIAGEWRKVPVRVGSHYPPEHPLVDREMREFFINLNGRLEFVGDDSALQVEALAYAEAHALHVHPFRDFNGRAVRVLIAELTRRLDLPATIGAVERVSSEYQEYVNCLAEYDSHRALTPMCAFWEKYRL